MTITVRLFAMARERAGTDTVELELPPGARVIDALQALARTHPRLGDVIARARVALNQEFTEPEQPISDGDEMALIPPVSGGLRN